MESNQETNKAKIEIQEFNLEKLSPEAQEVVKKAQEEINESFEDLTQAIEASAKNPEDFGKVSLIEKTRRLVNAKVLTALLAISSFSGMKAAETHTDFSHEDETKTEKSVSMQKDSINETAHYEDYTGGGKENVTEKPSTKLHFKTSFDLASAEISPEAKQSFENEVKEFIAQLSPEQQELLKKGEIILQVTSLRSPEKVQGTLETVGKKFSNNLELAEIAGEQGIHLVKGALSEIGIDNPNIILNIPRFDEVEPGVNPQGERLLEIKAINLNHHESLKNFDYVIVDPSGSMKDDVESIKEVLDGTQSKVIEMETKKTVQGDELERLSKTLKRVIDQAEAGQNIVFVTDEGDNLDHKKRNYQSLSSNKELLQEINEIKQMVREAKEKGISITGIRINVDNPKEKVIFDYLNDNNAIKNIDFTQSHDGDVKSFDNLRSS